MITEPSFASSRVRRREESRMAEAEQRNPRAEPLPFKKPDRYKSSSYRAFNFKFPEKYDSSLWMRICQVARWDKEVVSELTPRIESLRILDVGCATGRLLRRLGAAGAQRLCGLDLAPRIIEVARRKLADEGVHAELKSGDVEEEVPWPDGSFDVVTVTGALHHLFRPGDALRELNRVLCNNGRILIVEPWFPPPLRQLMNLYLRFFSHDGDCLFYAPAAVARMIEGLGWRGARYRRVGGYSFLISGHKGSV
jgi:ubiquinone/menaquinone biosynthesis C-methylase UbiE